LPGRERVEDLAIARAVHVLAVVIWLGGASMVTTVVLPAARRAADGPGLAGMIEARFSWQARVATLLAGASGFYMVERLDLWDRFKTVEYWWMHAMVGVWLLFSFILFVAEPWFLHRWFEARVQREPAATLALVQRAHWVLLAVSLITIAGAVAGSHGLSFF
jgi:uncharacterized membrane protein